MLNVLIIIVSRYLDVCDYDWFMILYFLVVTFVLYSLTELLIELFIISRNGFNLFFVLYLFLNRIFVEILNLILFYHYITYLLKINNKKKLELSRLIKKKNRYNWFKKKSFYCTIVFFINHGAQLNSNIETNSIKPIKREFGKGL